MERGKLRELASSAMKMTAGTWTLVAASLFAVTQVSAAPGWCKKLKSSESWSVEDIDSPDASRAMPTIALASCSDNTDAKSNSAKVSAARARWGKALDMNEDEWGDVAAYLNNRDKKEVPDETSPYSEWSPVAQYNWIEFKNPEEYAIDALGARLSESGRLAYIEHCVLDANPVTWAVCQGDIDSFDRKKIAGELRSDTKHDGSERTRIRFTLAHIDSELKDHEKDVAKLEKQDPAFAELFAKAAEGRKAWTADPKLIELANQMEDARISTSRKAREGCEAKTWPAFAAEISKLKAGAFAGVTKEDGGMIIANEAAVVMSNPNGYLAGIAHLSCVGRDHADEAAAGIAEYAAFTPGYRGPRTAGHTALLGVKPDKQATHIDFNTPKREWARDTEATTKGFGKGPVASVKTSGTKTTITFVKKTEIQSQCTSYKSTNHVLRIDSSGNVMWDYTCTSSHDVKVDVTTPPVTIDSKYVGGLKAGNNVWVEGGSVMIAWQTPTSKLPSIILGAPVK